MGEHSSLAKSLTVNSKQIGNRFSILPMEGWDGTTEGKPTELTRRRWENFGKSGAKLIWGGEAIAVRRDGRANPNQLVINDANLSDIEGLRKTLVDAHQSQFGNTNDLYVGLQLTHSGRFARPTAKEKLEPRTIYAHSVLDKKFKIESESALLSDDDLNRLIEDFVIAAVGAEKAGFEFVDVKHCHGYLGHELLSGYDRSGKFGGSFANRTRFLREIVAGITAETKLDIGTRVSIFDFVPFQKGADQTGEPMKPGKYLNAFGGDETGTGIDLALVRLMRCLVIP